MKTSAERRTLHLKKNEERRLKAGHLWIFSNEIDPAKSPVGDFEPGQEATIMSWQGKPVGAGYVNPRSLIAARLLSSNPKAEFDAAFLARRLRAALAWREKLAGPGFDPRFCRLVHAEGDYLPGLTLDRFGDVLVLQITTAGLERLKEPLLAALDELIRPKGMILRGDLASRVLEGLPQETETVGEVPEFLEVEEGGARFRVPALTGQKTGWFYDQRDNRGALARHCRGVRVLDAFSYAGGFGVRAALAGAASVTCLDASQPALEFARQAAEASGVGDRLTGRAGDAMESMRALYEAGERFEVVCLDPPAFIKRKKDFDAGSRAYLKANRWAMRLLTDDGLLMSCSCSQHFSADDLRQTLTHAGQEEGRRIQLVERRGQAMDHPVHPAMPETEYLKAFIVRARKG